MKGAEFFWWKNASMVAEQLREELKGPRSGRCTGTSGFDEIGKANHAAKTRDQRQWCWRLLICGMWSRFMCRTGYLVKQRGIEQSSSAVSVRDEYFVKKLALTVTAWLSLGWEAAVTLGRRLDLSLCQPAGWQRKYMKAQVKVLQSDLGGGVLSAEGVDSCALCRKTHDGNPTACHQWVLSTGIHRRATCLSSARWVKLNMSQLPFPRIRAAQLHQRAAHIPRHASLQGQSWASSSCGIFDGKNRPDANKAPPPSLLFASGKFGNVRFELARGRSPCITVAVRWLGIECLVFPMVKQMETEGAYPPNSRNPSISASWNHSKAFLLVFPK